MPQQVPPRLRITAFFEQALGAKLRNTQWSWGAESNASRVLFLRVWKDNIRKDGKCVQVFWDWDENDHRGGSERAKHLQMMRAGRPTFGVVCEAKDIHSKKRSIKDFNRAEFLRLGLPLRREGKLHWATIQERLSFGKMMEASGSEAAIQDDVAAVKNNGDLDQTTKQMLIDARLGQGKFRAQLMNIWNWRCAVTGSKTSEALRASHILPWSMSDNKARLDAANGFLFNASIDALFDRRVITFSDSGEMIVSKSVPPSERVLLGLEGSKLSKGLSARTKVYLAKHRKLFVKEEANRAAANTCQTDSS